MTAKRVAVVGAGIVGLACASRLAMRGAAVTLIDPEPPGSQCSSGNAGCLSRASCVPLGLPGVLRNVPGWLVDPAGPLVIRWRHAPALAPWLWRFWRSTSIARVDAIANALHALLDPSVTGWRELAAWARVPELIRQQGYAFAYRSKAAFEGDARGRELRRRRGVAIEILDGRAVRGFEPALAPDVTHLVLLPEQGHTTNPLRLAQALASRLREAGATFLSRRAQAFECTGGRALRVITDAQPVEADAFVIAAGARSRPLAAALGSDVPLETERGYHAMLAQPSVVPRIPVGSGEEKWFATPMEQGLRIAGTVELAGLEAAPDYRRADRMVEGAKRLFPALTYASVERWMGHRPSLPDSLPVIGPAPLADNVWFAFGHGHVGLTAAPMTARIVDALHAHQAPPIDVAPYAAQRFA